MIGPDEVEQLRLLAADADGAPLADEDLAFLGGDQQVLQLDGADRLRVIGIATTRYYPVTQVRAAIADARALWALVGHLPGVRVPDPLEAELALEDLPE